MPYLYMYTCMTFKCRVISHEGFYLLTLTTFSALCAHACICRWSHTNSCGVGADSNMQPAYLLSAAHLEPVLTYKGEVCTGKFVFIPAKGYVKVRCVCMPSITAGRINRGIVDINHRDSITN